MVAVAIAAKATGDAGWKSESMPFADVIPEKPGVECCLDSNPSSSESGHCFEAALDWTQIKESHVVKGQYPSRSEE